MSNLSSQNRQVLYQNLANYSDFSHDLTKCLQVLNLEEPSFYKPDPHYLKVKDNLLKFIIPQMTHYQLLHDFSTVVKGGPQVFQNIANISCLHGGHPLSTLELPHKFELLLQKLNYEGLGFEERHIKERQGKQGFNFGQANSFNMATPNQPQQHVKMNVFASSKSPSYNRVFITSNQPENNRNVTPVRDRQTANPYTDYSRSPIMRPYQSTIQQNKSPGLTFISSEQTRQQANLFSRPPILQEGFKEGTPTYNIGPKIYGQPFTRSPQGEYLPSRSPVQRFERTHFQQDQVIKKSPLALRSKLTPTRQQTQQTSQQMPHIYNRQFTAGTSGNETLNSKSPLHRRVFSSHQEELNKVSVNVEFRSRNIQHNGSSHSQMQSQIQGYVSQESNQTTPTRTAVKSQILEKVHSPAPSHHSSVQNQQFQSHHSQPGEHELNIQHSLSSPYSTLNSKQPDKNVQVYQTLLTNQQKMEVVKVGISPNKGLLTLNRHRYPLSKHEDNLANDDSRYSSQPEQLKKITAPYANLSQQEYKQTSSLTPAEATLQRVQSSMTPFVPRVEKTEPMKIISDQTLQNYVPFQATLKDYSKFQSPEARKLQNRDYINSSDSKKLVPLLTPTGIVLPSQSKLLERNIDPYTKTVQSRYPVVISGTKPSESKTLDVESSRTDFMTDIKNFQIVSDKKDHLFQAQSSHVKPQIEISRHLNEQEFKQAVVNSSQDRSVSILESVKPQVQKVVITASAVKDQKEEPEKIVTVPIEIKTEVRDTSTQFKTEIKAIDQIQIVPEPQIVKQEPKQSFNLATSNIDQVLSSFDLNKKSLLLENFKNMQISEKGLPQISKFASPSRETFCKVRLTSKKSNIVKPSANTVVSSKRDSPANQEQFQIFNLALDKLRIVQIKQIQKLNLETQLKQTFIEKSKQDVSLDKSHDQSYIQPLQINEPLISSARETRLNESMSLANRTSANQSKPLNFNPEETKNVQDESQTAQEPEINIWKQKAQQEKLESKAQSVAKPDPIKEDKSELQNSAELRVGVAIPSSVKITPLEPKETIQVPAKPIEPLEDDYLLDDSQVDKKDSFVQEAKNDDSGYLGLSDKFESQVKQSESAMDFGIDDSVSIGLKKDDSFDLESHKSINHDSYDLGGQDNDSLGLGTSDRNDSFLGGSSKNSLAGEDPVDDFGYQDNSIAVGNDDYDFKDDSFERERKTKELKDAQKAAKNKAKEEERQIELELQRETEALERLKKENELAKIQEEQAREKKRIEAEVKASELLKKKMELDAEDLYFKEGRNITDMPLIKRKYKPEIESIASVQEAQIKFTTFEEPEKLQLHAANAYRLDISVGGIVVYGGDNLNICQLTDDAGIKEIYTDAQDCKYLA